MGHVRCFCHLVGCSGGNEDIRGAADAIGNVAPQRFSQARRRAEATGQFVERPVGRARGHRGNKL